MQDYNTIIGAIQMRLNKCPTRSVMDRFRIGSSTLNLIMSRYKTLELTIDGKRTIASTCSYASFSAIIVSHDTESKKLST